MTQPWDSPHPFDQTSAPQPPAGGLSSDAQSLGYPSSQQPVPDVDGAATGIAVVNGRSLGHPIIQPGYGAAPPG
ncbi:MAG: hypothetical protein FWG47_08175, partial [Propionibacteriaceae bacterium]|nr:hypothetical protein [Propionibacteriaceae bacterium]